MVHIRTLRLIFPGDFGVGVSSWEEHLAVVRPSWQVRATAARLAIAVGRRKPHCLPRRENAVLRTICFANANVRPIMPRIIMIVAVNVYNRLAIWRPTRTEVEMVRIGGD